MKIVTIQINKSISEKIIDLKKDLDLRRELKNSYKISLNEYLNFRQIFKEKCRSLIPDLYRVKMFHFSDDFLRVHYGKTEPNTL